MLVLAKGNRGHDDLLVDYDKHGQQLTKAGIKTCHLTLSDARIMSSKSVAVKPIRHFTNIINESWAAGTMLACKAADTYHAESFDGVQANDLASLIAGIHLKWSFNIGLIYSADDNELANIRAAADEIREGIEEVMRFCVPYTDYVILKDSGPLEMLKSFGVSPEKIKILDRPSKIAEIYGRLVASK